MGRWPRLIVIQDAVVQVGVRTVLEYVELGVGDCGVIALHAHVRRVRARRSVGDAVARASSSRSSGSVSNSCWALVTTCAGCKRTLPSWFSRITKRWLGRPGSTTRLRLSVSTKASSVTSALSPTFPQWAGGLQKRQLKLTFSRHCGEFDRSGTALNGFAGTVEQDHDSGIGAGVAWLP